MHTYFGFLIAVLAALALSACGLEQPSVECTPGERECERNIYYECQREGKSWDQVVCDKDNVLGAFCNTERTCVACNEDSDCGSSQRHCVDHACQPLSVLACTEGSTRCEDSKQSTCLKKAWENEKTCSNGCNTGGTACQPAGACAPNSAKCDGDALMLCASNGIWLMDMDCGAKSQLCDAGKGCIECRNGRDCKDSKKTICNANTNTCQAPEAVCGVDETRCETDTFFACNANQSGFDTTVCAGETTHCDSDKGCIECRNSADCKDSTKAVCNQDTNTCHACILGETKCDGSTYKACNATQSGFDTNLCAGGTPYCDNTKGCVACRTNVDCKDETKPLCNVDTRICQACTPGKTKCNWDGFLECSPAGQWVTTLCQEEQSCSSEKGCVTALSHHHDFENCRVDLPQDEYTAGDCTVGSNTGKLTFTSGALISSKGQSLKLNANSSASVSTLNGINEISLEVRAVNISSNVSISIAGVVVATSGQMKLGSTIILSNDKINAVGEVEIKIETTGASMIDNLKWKDYYK